MATAASTTSASSSSSNCDTIGDCHQRRHLLASTACCIILAHHKHVADSRRCSHILTLETCECFDQLASVGRKSSRLTCRLRRVKPSLMQLQNRAQIRDRETHASKDETVQASTTQRSTTRVTTSAFDEAASDCWLLPSWLIIDRYRVADKASEQHDLTTATSRANPTLLSSTEAAHEKRTKTRCA